MNSFKLLVLIATLTCGVCNAMKLDLEQLLNFDGVDDVIDDVNDVGNNRRQRRSNGLVQAILMLHKSILQTQSVLSKEIDDVKMMVTSNVGMLQAESNTINEEVKESIANITELVNKEVSSLKAGQEALKAGVKAGASSIQSVHQAVHRNVARLSQGQGILRNSVTNLQKGSTQISKSVGDIQKTVASEMNNVKGLVKIQSKIVITKQTSASNKMRGEISGLKAVMTAFGTQLGNVKKEVKDTKEELNEGIKGVKTGQAILKSQTAAVVKSKVAEARSALLGEINEVKDAQGSLKALIDGVSTAVKTVNDEQKIFKENVNSEITAVKGLVNTEMTRVHDGQTTLSTLVKSEIAGIKSGLTELKDNVSEELTTVEGKLNAETLKIQDAQGVMKTAILKELEALKTKQESLSTELTTSIEKSKEEGTEVVTEVTKEIAASNKKVTTEVAAVKEATVELQKTVAAEIVDVKDLFTSSVGGVATKLDSAINLVSQTTAALANTFSEETKKQTKAITEKQDAIVHTVSVVQNLLTKETTRFSDPQFGETTVADITKYYVEGHVEVLHDGEWGTICETGITDNVANVLCKMGGYRGGEYNNGAYNQPTAPKAAKVWLDNLVCDSPDLNSLEDCTHKPWGEHSCTHYSDIGIRCFY